MHCNYVAGDVRELPDCEGLFCIKSMWEVVQTVLSATVEASSAQTAAFVGVPSFGGGNFLAAGFLAHVIILYSLQETSRIPASTPLGSLFSLAPTKELLYVSTEYSPWTLTC